MKHQPKKLINAYGKGIGLATVLFQLMIVLTLLMIPAMNYANSLFILNTVSQTISKYDIESGFVDNAFATTGLYPNKMAFTEEYIYLTNSGDGNVQKIDLTTGSTISHILLDEYSNPFDILYYEGYLYVTGLTNDTVYKIDTQTDQIIDKVVVGTAPQGLIVAKNRLYVANSGFSYPDYFDGEVSVINLANFKLETSIPVNLNPQRMALDKYGKIHLICTGDFDEKTGSVVIIDTDSNAVLREVDFGNFPTNILIPNNNRSYVGDAFGMGVYAYDTESYEIIYDSENIKISGGSSFYEYDNQIVIADAKDFISNSHIEVYDLEEELLYSFKVAIGAIDIGAAFRPTNIEESILTPMIAVYPNPSNEFFHFDIQLPQSMAYNKGVAGLTALYGGVFNLKGQLVKKLNVENQTAIWDGTDTSNRTVSSGIYLIRISDQGGKVVTSKRITLIK